MGKVLQIEFAQTVVVLCTWAQSTERSTPRLVYACGLHCRVAGEAISRRRQMYYLTAARG